MTYDVLITVHAVGISDPDAPTVATGGWNEDGTPKMKTNVRIIPPATFLPVAWLRGGETEAAALVASEVARWPEAHEIAANPFANDRSV